MAMHVDLDRWGRASALAAGDEPDPFSILGMHKLGDRLVVRAFLPGADRVTVLRQSDNESAGELEKLHEAGFFAGVVTGSDRFNYRLKVDFGSRAATISDPYSFASAIGDLDLHLHAEGTYLRGYQAMGAHPEEPDGVSGTRFIVWAPNARRVSVVGDFNAWDGRIHPMRLHPGAGLWELFLPGVHGDALYKYEIKTQSGDILLKADPYAFQSERAPHTASVVRGLSEQESKAQYQPGQAAPADRRSPVSIYEVHLGSWLRVKDEDNRPLRYDEMAELLVPYVKKMGFTHIELMPVSEYPFDGSWGYQPTALFAPTSRYGSPSEFHAFIRRCHDEGIGVILDWAAGHFPGDAHGLGRFDGTHLYEHQDPREGFHPDWDTFIFNLGRREVRSYLLSNALFWFSEFGIDGLRVDAVASMLYRNYSRKEGEWIPNVHGGAENLEAVDFLRALNTMVYREYPGAVTIAEESTAWPMVSRPAHLGGLGFGYKWNMGWMHDTLAYMSKDPVHRKYHHNSLTFGMLYAFNENFVLPLSHDEVVHGKGSLLAKMPGDRWQKFANLRAYFGFMFTCPGKKLLFMGGEFAQEDEWNHDGSLDWQQTEEPLHAGMQQLVTDLNRLYRGTPALYERDCEPEGFSWIDCNDMENSVISYVRRGSDPNDFMVIVCNFTPVVRENYRIGVPAGGMYHERMNTDSSFYGGSNVGNMGAVEAGAIAAHGYAQSLRLTLPPLATIVLQPAKMAP